MRTPGSVSLMVLIKTWNGIEDSFAGGNFDTNMAEAKRTRSKNYTSMKKLYFNSA